MVTHAASTYFLHVANGTATTRLFEPAGIPGRSSIWADPLYEGPVPGHLTDTELVEVRSRFLGGPLHADVDPVNDLRNWRAAIRQHESYEELVLWFEHDLFDQLNLIQLLTWIRDRLPNDKTVSLICIGSFPGRRRFKGLGELTADELASLFGGRKRVSEAQYSLAKRAWQAFREPTPEALEALLQADTTALPNLAPAVMRFLQEYPSTIGGLSRSERRLLELAEGDPVDLVSVFPRMHDGEDVYYITDGSLADLVLSLSRTSPPMITVTADENVDVGLLKGSVKITDFGRAVLAGQQDRIATCGIDRWLGGVHLQGVTDIWRWDEQRQRIAKQ